MAWVILEGLDRAGKTTLAKLYENQGYRLVHMNAPDKKYLAPGYTGPSYLDELLDIYMKNNAGDAVFDRSPYGELVWPLVYGRKSQLSEEDFEILKEIEENNQTERLLMYDSNAEAHWKRCVDNKEPLNKNQFNNAGLLFDRMATKHNFTKIQLQDAVSGRTSFVAPVMTDDEKKKLEDKLKKSTTSIIKTGNSTTQITVENYSEMPTQVVIGGSAKATTTPEQMKLEKANAINDVLSKRILKQKGLLYDAIEKDIRDYLNSKLGVILGGPNSTSGLSKEEVDILKVYCQQIKKKMENK